MKFSVMCLAVVATLILIPVTVHGEVWKVQIPTGSAEPNAPAHFLPTEISVRPGDKVEWGNTDTVNHTVTSGSLELGLTGIFDSGFMGSGSRYTVMFNEENLGEIKYFCKLHPWMIGIVNVVDLEPEFQVYHNAGSDVSEDTVDVPYKVQRNLVDIKVDTTRKSVTFSFVGKINNDEFVAYLSKDLIKDPQAVWINDKQTSKYQITEDDDTSILTMTLSDNVQQVRIVGTEVIGKEDLMEHILINQMKGITDKKFYERGDEIVISGTIRNPVQIYELSLDIISPKEVVVYHKDVQLIDSAKFTVTVPTSGTLREFGEYKVKVTGESAKGIFLSFEYGILPKEFQTPLKQMRAGTDAIDVLCNEGLELVMKLSNGLPACVKPSSIEKMVERGWAIHVLPDYEKNENNNSVTFELGDFEVETTNVSYFENSNGYLAKPAIDGIYPGVIMIHEWWGLNDNIKQMAEKLASHGYIVFAVDLYDGHVGTTADEARQLRISFEQSQWTENMNTAVSYLEEYHSPSSLGSIGWCFGGAQSLNLALNNNNMDATVIYYGQLVTDTEELSKINWPILGIFAELDNGIPPETVKEFEMSLDDVGIENNITIYPEVNHAFANPSGDRYAPNESKDAWKKTLEFFEDNLN